MSRSRGTLSQLRGIFALKFTIVGVGIAVFEKLSDEPQLSGGLLISLWAGLLFDAWRDHVEEELEGGWKRAGSAKARSLRTDIPFTYQLSEPSREEAFGWGIAALQQFGNARRMQVTAHRESASEMTCSLYSGRLADIKVKFWSFNDSRNLDAPLTTVTVEITRLLKSAQQAMIAWILFATVAVGLFIGMMPSKWTPYAVSAAALALFAKYLLLKRGRRRVARTFLSLRNLYDLRDQVVASVRHVDSGDAATARLAASR
jgi:hypothetical protein